MRKIFRNRQELLELLAKIDWDSKDEQWRHKMGYTNESQIGKWRAVVFKEVEGASEQWKWKDSPVKVSIYLDRHQEVEGYVVLHGALDSYIINGIFKEGEDGLLRD